MRETLRQALCGFVPANEPTTLTLPPLARGEGVDAPAAPGVSAPSPRAAGGGSGWGVPESLTRAIAAADPQAIALSGGLDSCLLLALAVEHGLRPAAYTVAPADEDDELATARTVAASLGVPHHAVIVPPDEHPAHFVAAVRAAGAFVFNGRGVLGVPLYRRMAADGVSRALSGLGADEVFAGNPDALADRDGEPAFVARLRPEWDLAASLLIEPPPRWRPDAAGLPLLRATSLGQHALPIEVPVARAAGVAVSLPYLDAAVVAAAETLELARDGIGKLPLRRLAEARLPALAHRRKEPRYAPPNPAWAPLLAELLAPPRLERRGGFVLPRVAALLDDWRRTHDPVAERVLLRIASAVVLEETPCASS